MHMSNLRVSAKTLTRLKQLSVHYKTAEPDTRVTHDYVIRKLLTKFEGDLQ
jgi:hypothetical protein